MQNIFSVMQKLRPHKHCKIFNICKRPVFSAFSKLLCDHNFKDFYKISILVCQYKPEVYQKKMGAISIITYEGVASNLLKSKLHTYIIQYLMS